MDSIESLIPLNQQNVSHQQERNPGATLMAARKREINEIMRMDSAHLTRLPIRLSHPSHSAQITSGFSELWLKDKYQSDVVFCEICEETVARQKASNSNLIRHLNFSKA